MDDFMNEEDDRKPAPKTPEEFRDHVVAGLATLHVGLRGVHSQLKRMNGTQATLLERMMDVETTQKTHPLSCPIGDRVGKIEITLAKNDTEKATDKKWFQRLKPYILLAAGAGATMLLSHIDQWISLIKK